MNPRYCLRIALGCSLAPLTLGVVIFVVWLPTHWDFLALGGLLNVVAGTCLFPIGLGSAWLFHRGAGDDPWRNRKAAFAAALLVLNFSTALSVMTAASWLGSECVVVLENRSSTPIDRFTVGAGSTSLTGLDLPPGAHRSFRFRGPGDAGVRYSLVQGSATRDGFLEGLGDASLGGDWRLTLASDGSIRMLNLRQPFQPERIAE